MATPTVVTSSLKTNWHLLPGVGDGVGVLGQDFSTIGFTTLTSSSNPALVNTLSPELAICRSCSGSTRLPTPKDYTVTPLSFRP